MEKQRKREEKAAERRERNARKKAIADGTIEAPKQPDSIDPATLQPEAFGVTPEEPKKPAEDGGD